MRKEVEEKKRKAVEVGIEKIEPKQIKDIIQSRKRENAGKTLPPEGLYLVKVEYE